MKFNIKITIEIKKNRMRIEQFANASSLCIAIRKSRSARLGRNSCHVRNDINLTWLIQAVDMGSAACTTWHRNTLLAMQHPNRNPQKSFPFATERRGRYPRNEAGTRKTARKLGEARRYVKIYNISRYVTWVFKSDARSTRLVITWRRNHEKRSIFKVSSAFIEGWTQNSY